MKVKIVPRTAGAPAGKLADAELHFSDGLLAGLKLVGFTVWTRHREIPPACPGVFMPRNTIYISIF